MNKLFLFLIPTLVFSQTSSKISVTPGQPVVVAGGATTIAADRPVSFKLSGVGSITPGSDPKTVIYNAPKHLTPQHQMNGCMVGPDDSIYNTRIDNLPVATNSDQWTFESFIGTLAIDFQWGTNLVDNSYPLTPLTFHYSTSLNNTGFPIPALPDKKRETGAYTTDTNADHHMLVLNRQSCRFYETYQEGVPNLDYTAASGWIYNGTSYVQPSRADGGGSTDAAGLPLAPLTVHLSEIHAGAINHALRFTSCLGCISNQFVWPANLSTGAEPTAPPMGTRFRLKSSFDVSPFPPAAQVVLTAMKQYGMILADVGMSGHASASSDVTEDPEVARALQSIAYAHIDYSNFEIVDESSLMLDPASSAVNPNNPYVHAINQAVLTVTDAANPKNVVKLPIALQSVTVGTPDPAIVVEAGTQAFPIHSWVNGTGNQGVVWSISSPAAGSIDSSGNYTAPRTVSAPLHATLTATSVADPTASTTVAVTLLPFAFIPIDSGSAVSTIGDGGYTWMADIGFETGSFNTINDNYPSNAWGSISIPVQTESYMYTWGDDIQYRLHVPNGNYLVAFTFGVGECTAKFGAPFNNNSVMGPMNIESQGRILLNNWNFGIPIGNACRTPYTLVVPAIVTDTNLQVALRAVIDGNGNHSTPLVNGLKISRHVRRRAVFHHRYSAADILEGGNQHSASSHLLFCTGRSRDVEHR